MSIVIVILIVIGKILIDNKNAEYAKAPKFNLKSKFVEISSAKRGDLNEQKKYIAKLCPLHFLCQRYILY